MTGSQLAGGFFGAGLALGIVVLVTGLSGRPLGLRSQAIGRGVAARFDPRQLSGQGPRVICCTAVAGATTLWTGWPTIAPLSFAACWWLPRVLGPDRASQAAIDRGEAVAGFAEMLRDTLGAAAGLQQTILAVYPLAPLSIRAACLRLAEAVESGMPVALAVAQWADDVADRDADAVAAALIVAAKRQSGNTAAILGTVASAARDYADIRRRAMASQAKTRTSGRVVIGTVLGLTGLMVVADRGFMSAYDSFFGQAVLLFAAGVFAVALRWMNRLMHPAPPPRVLTGLSQLATQQEEARAW